MIPNEFSVEGKAAIVTGAGRGIGRAIATTLAEAGADVAVISRTRTQVEETAHMIEKLGRRALALQADVSSEEQVNDGVRRVLSAFGRVDILCSNAGIFLTKPVAASPEEKIAGSDLAGDSSGTPLELQDWRKVLDTNLTGTFAVTRELVRGMMRRRWGRIVTVSSVVGLMGNAGQANYAAAKAGLIGFTKSVARELASRNVTANVVAPGFVETAMTGALPEETRQRMLADIPAGRFGLADEMAAAVAYLASEEAGYVTGQVLNVSGGLYI